MIDSSIFQLQTKVRIMKLTDPIQFLSLFSQSDLHLYCCFHEQSKIRSSRAFKGEISEHFSMLKSLNQDGYGIYFTVNACKNQKRLKESMLFPRAIFQDDDHAYTGTYPLEPNIVVETSPGKYQRYWLIDYDSIAEQDMEKVWNLWDLLQKRIVESYGGDPSAKDRSRVLRLPGFRHTKQGYNIDSPTVTYEINDKKAYLFSDLIEAFDIKVTPDVVDAVYTTENKLIRAKNLILTGENFNDALCTLSMHFIEKSYPQEFIYDTLMGYMHQSVEKGTKRWQERVDHLPRMIQEGIKKKEGELTALSTFIEESEDVAANSEHIDIPMPPGFLGDIVRDVEQFMMYPDRNIAVVTALHIISALGGRQYMYKNTGLTCKRVLLAKPGRGKDTPNKYFTTILNQLESEYNVNDSMLYHGSGDFTSPQLLHNELVACGSKSFIRSEAGQALLSKSGDLGGLKAYILQLLSSDFGVPIQPKSQRKKETDSHMPLYHINAAFLDESVPDLYIDALKEIDAVYTGELARCDIIFANDYIEANNNIKYSISTNILSKLFYFMQARKNLSSSASGADKLTSNDVVLVEQELGVQERLDELHEEEIKIRNNTVDLNPFMNGLYQRRQQSRFKLLLTCAVADSDPVKKTALITHKHLDWVSQYQDTHDITLIKKVDLFEETNDVSLQGILCLQIEKVLKSMKQGNLNCDKRERKALKYQILTRSRITHAFKLSAFNKYVKQQHKGNRRRAMQAILSELYENGKIIRLTRQQKQNIAQQLNVPMFNGEVYQYLCKFNMND